MATVAFMRIEKIKIENAELRNYVTQLEVNIDIKDMQVKDLQDELTGLYQQIEQQEINIIATGNEYVELRKQHTHLSIWADLAEYVLAQNFEFRKAQ
jgi:SMC interacting uncharacterized protein involved in chromosome segregation